MKRHVELKSGVRGQRPPGPDRGPDRKVYSTERHVLNPDPRDSKPTSPERNRVETLSVALAQPHRRGSDDPRLSTALGRFCAAPDPRPLGNHCYQAGARYAEIVREFKKASGFHVHGWSEKTGEGDLSEKELLAKQELAVIKMDEAKDILRAIMPRLPFAMERLCYDDLEPSPHNREVIVAGLVKLADEWGYSPKRFGAAA